MFSVRSSSREGTDEILTERNSGTRLFVVFVFPINIKLFRKFVFRRSIKIVWISLERKSRIRTGNTSTSVSDQT
jgi:hypothetical protein